MKINFSLLLQLSNLKWAYNQGIVDLLSWLRIWQQINKCVKIN